MNGPAAGRAVVERVTRETRVRIEAERGEGSAQVATGLPFLDHMLVTFARYSGINLTLNAEGDLKHHTIEDVAIALGEALRGIAGPSVARYGNRTIPMDDALVQACIDIGGRPYYRGPLPSSLYDHWMRSFADNARATIHLRVMRGSNRHHIIEAAFKALALAAGDAIRTTTETVLSTKGAVSLEIE